MRQAVVSQATARHMSPVDGIGRPWCRVCYPIYRRRVITEIYINAYLSLGLIWDHSTVRLHQGLNPQPVGEQNIMLRASQPTQPLSQKGTILCSAEYLGWLYICSSSAFITLHTFSKHTFSKHWLQQSRVWFIPSHRPDLQGRGIILGEKGKETWTVKNQVAGSYTTTWKRRFFEAVFSHHQTTVMAMHR